MRWIRPSFHVILMYARPIGRPPFVGAFCVAHAHVHPCLAQQLVLLLTPSTASSSILLLFVVLFLLAVIVVAIPSVALAELICVGAGTTGMMGDNVSHDLDANILCHKTTICIRQ